MGNPPQEGNPMSRRIAMLAAGALALAPLLWMGVARAVDAKATGTDIYVSPTGDDTNAGTSASAPLKTLAHARDVARGIDQASSGDIRINLASGTYRLTEPLALSAADSGTNGNTITWQAASGAKPVVSGGLKVTGWKKGSGSTWSAQVPAGFDTRQLYVNGTRAQRASGALPIALKQSDTGYTTSTTNPMDNWRNPTDIEFVYKGGLGLWTEPRCPVASISPTVVKMAQPCWDNSTKRVMRTDGSGRTYNLVGRQKITEQPTLVENAYELLDKAGEFYLDQPAHTLYYIPRTGEDLTRADVEAAALETLVSGKNVANVAIKGIQFSYATWLGPNTGTGFSEIQATYQVTGSKGWATQGLCSEVPGGTCPYANWTKAPANVSFTYSKNVVFDRDAFAHLGGAGLDLGDGVQNSSVKGSVFTDISGNGLDLGGVDINLPTAAADHTSGNTIADNWFHYMPVEYHGGVAIDVGYTEHTTISHNQIDHTSYTGISIGWGGWPDKIKKPALPNYSNNNTIDHNLFFDFMQTLDDGGAIYTNGITGSSFANGQKEIGNLAYNGHNTKGGHIYYTDNGASYITINGNAAYGNHVTDWGSNHVNYTKNDGSKDPLDIENNYWETGPTDTVNSGGIIHKNNHKISGASGVPASITNAAGVEAAYKDILNFKPA
jgi:hypothetical protein